MPEPGEIKVARYPGRRKYLIYRKFIWHICVDCGKGGWIRFVKGNPVSIRCYSCARKLVVQKQQEKLAAQNWEGGRAEVRGYIYIRLYPKSPFYPMASAWGRIAEHRLVMAKHLNRCLLPWEVVHHKNGIPNDNRTENLELITDKRFHLIDSVTKGYIGKLKKRVEKLEMQVKLLQWRINEHEKTNVQEVNYDNK